MEYQKANILIPHMLEFFDGRVCKQFKEYRDWDSEIKKGIGLHVLETHGLVQRDEKAQDHTWTLTGTLFDSVRRAGMHLQEFELRAAGVFLPGPTSLKAKAPDRVKGPRLTDEQKRYAERLALSIEESYPMFIAIVATMVAMSGPFPGHFEKKLIRTIVNAIVSVIQPKG